MAPVLPSTRPPVHPSTREEAPLLMVPDTGSGTGNNAGAGAGSDAGAARTAKARGTTRGQW
jgi:hypothetical protein